MTLPSRRLGNLFGFLICSAMMAYALYAEHVLYYMPCPLCVFQRIAIIAIGIAFLVAAVHNPGRSRAYAGLLGLTGLFGVGVAGRHVWMQHLPADEVPSCGPGLGYMVDNFPFSEVLATVFTGSGECAKIDWEFLGLSMPMWVLIAAIALGVGGVWNNLRR